MRTIYQIGLFVVVILGMSVAGAPAWANVWDAWIDRVAARRFIPLELWSGAMWAGEHRISYPQSGHGPEIIGPIEWRHPHLGLAMRVYQRNPATRRTTQYFAVRKDGTGLGRVYESLDMRALYGEVTFPLGWWRDGERRRFMVVSWRNGEAHARTVTITIRRLDFTWNRIPHCLQYDWAAHDRGGTEQNVYTYCPDMGLVFARS